MYLTSQFPYGQREAFLGAEARMLAALAGELRIVAIRPRSKNPLQETGAARAVALRTLSLGPTFDALRTLRAQPRDVLRVAVELCAARYRFTAKLKNFVVLGKALTLAQYVRRERITHIHAHWLTTPSTVAYIAGRLTGIPWSVTGHRFDLFADNWIATKVGTATAVRVISERGAQDLRERTPTGTWNRIRVVHLGVELPADPAHRAPRAGPLRVVAVGLLTAVKGHAVLIDAVGRLRDWGITVDCTIAGDGPLRKTLQAQIDRLGLSNAVHLRGFVSHATLMRELETGLVDVVAHPSIESGNLHEGIPVSLMEAMACRVPCVATRTGSIPELIDESCGLLVEQRDPMALARALRKLAQDSALRVRLGAAARQRIRSGFDVRQTAAMLLQLMDVEVHAPDRLGSTALAGG